MSIDSEAAGGAASEGLLLGQQQQRQIQRLLLPSVVSSLRGEGGAPREERRTVAFSEDRLL